MEILLDRGSAAPLYRQIERQVRAQILSGALRPGFRLPPERRLATALGVNRTTVLAAYRELRADQLVASRVGRGTEVVGPPSPRPSAGSPPWRQLFRDSVPGAADSLVRDLLQLTERSDAISLAVGLPAADLVPVELVRTLLDRLLSEIGAPLLLYGPTEGLTLLRETLAGWLAGRGIDASATEVMVLSGSQQGLDLVARALLEPGDEVVVEEPSYFGALQVFRAAGARLLGIPIDDDGMRTDLLEAVLERQRPKLIYTLPTFQNPSGRSLPSARREHLLELAARHGVPVLEDDPYSDLRYEGDPLPSLRALDQSGTVLYLSTFSKVLFPGLRLGFMVAPRPVVRQLALVKQLADLHTGTAAQWLLERLLSEGHYPRHVETVRGAYRARRDAMEAALGSGVGRGLRWRRPEGGFYLWITLPPGLDRSRLMAHAGERGVSFLPGWACSPDRPGEQAVRLSFSYPPPDRITAGVGRFLDAVAAATAETSDDIDQVGTQPIV